MSNNLFDNQDQFIETFYQSNYYEAIKTFDIQSYLKNIVDYRPRDLIDYKSNHIIYYYLDYIVRQNPNVIYDIGAGNSYFKLLLKDIVSIVAIEPYPIRKNNEKFISDDYTVYSLLTHPDLQITFEEFSEKNKNFVEYAWAINSLHFIPITNIKKQFLKFVSIFKKNGRGFITFNVGKMIEYTDEKTLLKLFGTTDINQSNWHITHEYIIEVLQNLEKKYKKYIDFLILDLSPIYYHDNNGNIKIIFDVNKTI